MSSGKEVGVTAGGDISPCPPGKRLGSPLRVGSSYGLEEGLCFIPVCNSQGQTDGAGGGNRLLLQVRGPLIWGPRHHKP